MPSVPDGDMLSPFPSDELPLARSFPGEVYRGTLTSRRKNGEVYLASQTVTPLKTPDGEISHLVSIARDVTEQRKATVLENSLRRTCQRTGLSEKRGRKDDAMFPRRTSAGCHRIFTRFLSGGFPS
jgi:hypothetical protein